jgi:hypothetical protein
VSKPKSAGPGPSALRQVRAWDLKRRGWTHRRIGEALGITESSATRLLNKLEDRELKRLSDSVARQKAAQTGWAEHWIDEAMQAWEASKQPERRVTVREDADGAKTTVTQVGTREGDPAHLDRAMKAAAELRRLWGLDAPVSRPTEDTTGQLTYAGLIQRLKENAATHDLEPADPEPDPDPDPADPGPGPLA